jgi:hypothetical protein
MSARKLIAFSAAADTGTSNSIAAMPAIHNIANELECGERRQIEV